MSKRGRFMAVAVVFHLVYIYSIFDIYFVSPIVSGMRMFEINREPSKPAPADRLVLFVGDGLRADKAFQSHPEPYPKTDEDLTPRPLAPFLRSRVLEHGTFGVSHTRVPTESRPGHVALIAGLYEDVSAVMTGWKLNPVNFDSVFNRSRHTWSWGSPDILPMFEKGAVPGRVDAYMYEAEDEDFSQDATHLDYWVFDHVEEMFTEAKHNATLAEALRQDKVVFFLHLLGLDTAGHSFRPYSPEYLHNIKVVDEGVSNITRIVNEFYGDDRTAFVFTADHGMSDWGSHGDGHPDNTRTPLIAWGSGVAKPRVATGDAPAAGHDEFSSDWGLDKVQRHDVAQADVAALMAFLIGVEFPANSVGEIPLPFLTASNKEKAEATLVNAQGILEMYRVKEEKKKGQSQLRFKPYKALAGGAQNGSRGIEERVADIRRLIDGGNHEEAIEESAALIKVGLEGLRYLQTYDWVFLRALVTIGYLGWMTFALMTVLDMHVLHGQVQPARDGMGLAASTAVLVLLFASFIASGSPPTYYAYAFFPVFFWEEVYARRQSLVQGRRLLFAHIKPGVSLASFVLNAAVYVAVIVSLAHGYIHREVLTGLFILGAFWPASYGISFLQEHAALAGTWFVSCLGMSTFTLLSAIKIENLDLILIGGALMVVIGLTYLSLESFVLRDFSSDTTPPVKKHVNRALVGAQIGLVILAMLVTRSTVIALKAKKGLPLGNQVAGLFVLISSFILPIAYRVEPNNHYLHRLMVAFLTFAPTFVILTISYEGLFYVAFCITLVAWVRLEHAGHIYSSRQAAAGKKISANGATTLAPAQPSDPSPAATNKYRALTLTDARVALFFFVLLQSAFFSTGNMASVSQFSLESVNRIQPIFDPLTQGVLLTLKLLVPFAILSANVGVLTRRLGVPPSALFMLVIAVSDFLTLYFFWVVKDEGSWLEIGSTISHFVIASMMCVFVALLEGVSTLFVAGVKVSEEGRSGGRRDADAKVAPTRSNGKTATKALDG